MSTYRGYVSSRHLDGSCIPQRVQNLVIRDYATKEGLPLGFSAVEYNMTRSYMMLSSLANALDYLGLIFYSVHQLLDGKCDYKKYLIPVLDSGKSIHFALENMSIRNKQDLSLLDQLVCVKVLSQGTSSRIKALI